MDFTDTEYTHTTKSDMVDQDSILERCMKEGSEFTQKMILLNEIDKETFLKIVNASTDPQNSDVTLEVSCKSLRSEFKK